MNIIKLHTYSLSSQCGHSDWGKSCGSSQKYAVLVLLDKTGICLQSELNNREASDPDDIAI